MKTRQLRKNEQEKRLARFAKRLESKSSIFNKNDLTDYHNNIVECSVKPEKKIAICDVACFCSLCSKYKIKLSYCNDPWSATEHPKCDNCYDDHKYISVDAARAHHKDVMHKNNIYANCDCFDNLCKCCIYNP